MKREELKSLFLLDPGLVFLNHGSFGARPREVAVVQDSFRREAEANPVEFLGRRSGALLDAAMAEMAPWLGADPADLVFVANATTGVNVAARSIALQPGDEVLGSDHEYGACARAWELACAEKGAVYRSFPVPLPWRGDADFIARLEAAITTRTKVLFLSHITSPTALLFPVEAACRLARSRGIACVVDGAHAPAQVGLSLGSLGADYYAGNCHKWMCAPLGSAFLHVKAGRHAEVEPPIASWGRVAEREGLSPHDAYAGTATLARRLQWLGTRDVSPFLSVPAALAFLARHDGPEVASRCARQATDCARRATALLGLENAIQEGAGLRMALVPLPPCDGAALKAALFEEFRIEVPVTSHGGKLFLRLSFHVYNDADDAEALLSALTSLFPHGVPVSRIAE